MPWQKSRTCIQTGGIRTEGFSGKALGNKAEVNARHRNPFTIQRTAMQAIDVVEQD